MTIYALALGSNSQRVHWLQFAVQQLKTLGYCQISAVYEIPCRQGKGADYYNLAVLLSSEINLVALEDYLRDLEQQAGRVRPSQLITLDIDVIAHGEQLDQLQLIAKRLPLPIDVSLPLSELWDACPSAIQKMSYIQIKNILK